MGLVDLAAFNTARRQANRLRLATAACVVLAAFSMSPGAADGAFAAMRLATAASFALLGAGFMAAAFLAQARHLALRAEDALRDPAAEPTVRSGGDATDARLSRRARRRATWQQALAGGLLAALAAVAAGFACAADATYVLPPSTTAALAAGSLCGAFALLVVERHLAGVDPSLLPEAPRLAALVRVPIATLMLCGLGCLLIYSGITQGAYAGRIAAILSLLVAAELTMRALATLFVPFPPRLEEQLVPTSMVAGALILRWPRPIGETVRNWVGIDLSRSWAIAFMRAALAPVLAVLVLFGWGLSGVEALRVDQRAIYERLGRPVAVVGPGLHLHLPWPFGRLRPMELGVLHDVPIVFDASDATAGPPLAPDGVPDAEAQPGPEADRLWDEMHPSEAAYVVASMTRGHQSFQSVNIDLRVVYRVGLSDAAAMAAAYATSSPQRLVQARASRLLAHYFADHTLLDVLGADRARIAGDIMQKLQAELDAVPAGVQIMAVIVEAIHPPPGASAAYHAVQTAQINAHTAVAEADGDAVSQESLAQRKANSDFDVAAALSHEVVMDATINSIGFAADREADAANPASFLLERKLDRLGGGLAHRQLLIIDHRIAGQGGTAPIIDMRPPGSGGTVELPLASSQAQ